MTITTEQLDELETAAKSAIEESKWQGVAAGSWFEQEHVSDALREFFEETPRTLLEAEAAHIAANSPDVTLRLVSIARAALAWRDARLARQGVQTRAGLAETSAEHHAAMAEMPAAKEADVLACLNLLSALGPP